MQHLFRSRRLLVAALAVVLALSPVATPAHAQEGGGSEGGTMAGAIMAIACGASARIATVVREPIVIVVTLAICGFAFADAMSSPDSP